MKRTEGIYNALVNRVPGIQEKYRNKRKKVKGIGRIGIWAELLVWNFSYYVLRYKKLGELEMYPFYEKKKLYAKGSESSLSFKETPETFAGKLKDYDAVSFDIFDTLIFRPFEKPTDLFYLLSDKLSYPDFKHIREEAEQKARRIKYKKEGHNEITLSEIYDVLEREAGIEKNSGMEAELSLEYTFCFANPYMKQVVELLRKTGKRLIVTSDMYLGKEQLEKLLKDCGYGEFDAVYVSCEYNKSKSKGDLYDFVREKEKSKGRIAHIGDNAFSDIKNAKAHGFDAYYYRNVNEAGADYRPSDMSVITGSLYRGMVNAHIHSGLKKYPLEYEYGYIYGGLFVTGYCQFIHRYVKEHGIDKILFLARDGDVLQKAYHILYPEEDNKSTYAYWSRITATKLTAGYFKYDYLRRFLYHKTGGSYTLGQVFDSMELSGIPEGFYEKTNLTPETVITEKTADMAADYLIDNWEAVLSRYKGQSEAAKKYYSELLSGSTSAVAVDIGWAGSGAMALDCLINKEWNLNCPVTGIVAGTNTCHNENQDYSEAFLQSGKLVSYMYSQRENRDLWKKHNPGRDHNLYFELLLDAPHGSLKGFYPGEHGGYELKFKESSSDTLKTMNIQKGILDFVEDWKKLPDKEGLFSGIGGRDAYAPMLLALNEKNRKFIKRFANQKDDANL